MRGGEGQRRRVEGKAKERNFRRHYLFGISISVAETVMSAESISGSLKAVSETALGPGKSVRKAYCGSTSSGDRVVALQLKNESMALTLLSYGARVQSLTRDSEDLVLKLDNIGAYEADKSFLGASIGRVTNRIKNATFELDDGQYRVASAASHALHGGDKGFDKHVWGVESVRINDSGDLQASFVRISPDGEAGFPGTVQVTARCDQSRGKKHQARTATNLHRFPAEGSTPFPSTLVSFHSTVL